MDTRQDSFVCIRPICGLPVELTAQTARTLRYRLQPGFGQVLIVCPYCQAYNELQPGAMLDLADELGCPVRVMGDYAPIYQVTAYQEATGLTVITADHPVTTFGQAYLDKLAAMSQVPEMELDQPSGQDDMFDRDLRALIDDGALSPSDEAKVAELAAWLGSVTNVRFAQEIERLIEPLK